METKETAFIFTERANKNQCFDKRLIKHIVDLVEQGVPRRDLILEYGMTKGTLIEWLRKHQSSGASRRVYTAAEKRSVIRAVTAGMSIKQAYITFNISSASVVRGWIREFKQDNADLSVFKTIEVAKKTAEAPEDLELKALKKALEEANLKIRALDTLIDIAEDQLKIDIRKKSGARQSSK